MQRRHIPLPSRARGLGYTILWFASFSPIGAALIDHYTALDSTVKTGILLASVSVWLAELVVEAVCRLSYPVPAESTYQHFVFKGDQLIAARPGKRYWSGRVLAVKREMDLRLEARHGLVAISLTARFRNEEPTAEDARALNQFCGRLRKTKGKVSALFTAVHDEACTGRSFTCEIRADGFLARTT